MNLYSSKKRTKFQSIISVFGCVMVKKKQVKLMMSLHQNAFFAFPISVRQNKICFWNPDTKLDKISMF